MIFLPLIGPLIAGMLAFGIMAALLSTPPWA